MSASLKIDLTQVPFSAKGSFLAVSQLPAHWQGLPNAAGLYLRTVRHDVQTPLIAQISCSRSGRSLANGIRYSPRRTLTGARRRRSGTISPSRSACRRAHPASRNCSIRRCSSTGAVWSVLKDS